MPDSDASPRNDYEREFVAMMADVDVLIESITNPHHRKILVNYRRHGLLEVAGRYAELLAPTMTVEEPAYRIVEGGKTTLLTGMAQVRAFYESLHALDMLVMWTGRQRMAVHDWGFAGEAQFSQFVPGRMMADNVFAAVGGEAQAQAQAEGGNKEGGVDPDAWYLVRRTFAFVWPYAADGRMIGEHVYEDPATKTVERVDKDVVITGARAAVLLAPIIDKYGRCED
ncbi:hypothetical protein CC85DRAFT_310380 [Cutaneotrichosporon oleaginosum]|uniref:SnoaL-like domain-containing protein n=1 Tax=Cutaneotrichosporon oleaginosum TaxID=879819 RepID=A0A0J0XX02_9TREE|nr:uncharacterized protein CC85DRAFT_310380 [Cutaneotrichosporon oleaginosum]KLT45573.1 hypothetical protein CC85DRAFT_310380 [Cutaneotrichosporon oleaginosum]TXT04630.1 hypothetical protein COLE_07449 [Cutaneotrichosporon oleaginosum]